MPIVPLNSLPNTIVKRQLLSYPSAIHINAPNLCKLPMPNGKNAAIPKDTLEALLERLFQKVTKEEVTPQALKAKLVYLTDTDRFTKTLTSATYENLQVLIDSYFTLAA